jgi:hypothetical protein
MLLGFRPELVYFAVKLVGNDRDNRRRLNQLRYVVNKIDQDRNAKQRQNNRQSDGNIWHERLFAIAPNSAQDQQVVHKSSDERSEHKLIAAVAGEISQQARPQLGRGQCQHNNRDEKTTPATVIIEPAIVDSSWRAPSMPPIHTRGTCRSKCSRTTESKAMVAKDKQTLVIVRSVGTNQKLDRIAFAKFRSLAFIDFAA